MRSLFLALCLSLGAVGVAQACGAGLLKAMLFAAYPEAETAERAADAAADLGLIASDRQGRAGPIALHREREALAAGMLARLRERLAGRMDGLEPGARAYLFLPKAFKWIELTAERGTARLSPVRFAEDKSAPILFASRAALDALLDGRMSWAQARSARLVAITGSAPAAERWSAALTRMFRRSDLTL